MNKKLDKKIELEYRFTIPINSLKIIPPSKVGQFALLNSGKALLHDVLLERKDKTLKSENIGLRVRKQDSKYALTYKKFLGLSEGVAKFDERNLLISEKDFNQVLVNDFSIILDNNDLSALMNKEGIYILLEIWNQRTVYKYESGLAKIELIVEEVKYKSNGKTADDAMIEIEISSEEGYMDDIKEFVDNTKGLYDATESEEGKNSRGMDLLGLQY